MFRRFRRPLPLIYLVVLVLVFAGAISHAPTNYDGLTYRLPRMLNWLSTPGMDLDFHQQRPDELFRHGLGVDGHAAAGLANRSRVVFDQCGWIPAVAGADFFRVPAGGRRAAGRRGRGCGFCPRRSVLPCKPAASGTIFRARFFV